MTEVVSAARRPVVHPSGWWYAVPVIGLVLAAILGIEILRDGQREARRVVNQASVTVPGEEQTLTIDEPGGYTIGLVGIDVLRGADDKEQVAEALDLEVVSVDGGAPLPLARYEGFDTVDNTAAGGQYVPLRTVRFEEKGDYLLRSRPQPGLDREQTVLVLTQSPFRKIAGAVRAAAILGGVALFLAALVTVILARARGRSRRAIRAAVPSPFPPWSGPTHGLPPGGSPGPWPPSGRP